jgi:hypothetical protein
MIIKLYQIIYRIKKEVQPKVRPPFFVYASGSTSTSSSKWGLSGICH